jgi:GTPase SAR1 family protein
MHLLKWRDELLNKLPQAVKKDFPIIIIGNKIDERATDRSSGVDLEEVSVAV